jgi:hypothetical protein
MLEKPGFPPGFFVDAPNGSGSISQGVGAEEKIGIQRVRNRAIHA